MLTARPQAARSQPLTPGMRGSAPESCTPIRMKIRLFSMNTRMFHTERARMRICAETMAGE